MRQNLAQGYRFLLGRRPMPVVVFMVAVIHFFVGSIEVILPVLAGALGGLQAANLGVLQGCFGAGMVGMAALIGFRGLHGQEAKALFGAVSAVGLVYLLVGVLTTLTRQEAFFLSPFFLAFGAAIAVAAASFQSLLQKMTPNDLAGRVFSVVGTVGNGTIPLAALCYGFAMARLPYNHLLGLYRAGPYTRRGGGLLSVCLLGGR